VTTAIVKPTTPKEWEEYVNGFDTPEKFANAFKDGSFKESLKAYTGAQNKTMEDLNAQVNEQVQLAMAEFAKNSGLTKAGNKLDLNFTKVKPQFDNVYNNNRAVGAGLNGKFANKAEFFQAVWHENKDSGDSEVQAKRRMASVVNSFSERVPSEGGYLVPEEFRSDILQLSLENALVRSKATVIPMSSLTLSYPCIDDTSHVSNVYGGITGYWVEEGGAIPESNATFAEVKLTARKLAALATVSNELVRDWTAFGGWINTSVPKALSWFEDLAFISGSGVGKPLGMLHSNNPALIVQAARSGQGASTIVWENVLDMYSRLLPQSLNTAEWWVGPDVFVQLATMALVVGTGGSAVWLTDGTGRPTLTLLGLPVRMTEKVPSALGTAGDINLVDPQMYLIGDRQTMTVSSSEHRYFEQDKTVYKVIERVDGQPWLLSAITPQNNSSTLSSFIQLNSTRT
jgi:HK97 family phage major capsid protein